MPTNAPTKSYSYKTPPPSVAAAPKTTDRAPAGTRTPRRPKPLKGPKEAGGVKKPSTAEIPQPPSRPTETKLDWLKRQAENPNLTDAQREKLGELVAAEESRVDQGNANYFAKLGEMTAKIEAFKQQQKEYQQAVKSLNARKLAGL